MRRSQSRLLGTRWAPALKRSFDVMVAAAALLLLAPMLCIVALVVRAVHGSPVLFRQARPGRNDKIFQIVKFRTMSNRHNQNGELLPDAERLTGLGRFLRSTSLDELPELLNVLRGDMSLVGPRPLLPEYLPYYTEEERLRHAVRPGLTGWAQVNGRNYRPWDERLALDVWYVSNWSFLLDLKILALTVIKVMRRSDVAVDAGQVENRFDRDRAGRQDAAGRRVAKELGS